MTSIFGHPGPVNFPLFNFCLEKSVQIVVTLIMLRTKLWLMLYDNAMTTTTKTKR